MSGNAGGGMSDGFRQGILGVLGLVCWIGVPVAASAEPVYLSCNDNISPISLAIDYEAGTVTIMNMNTGRANADIKGQIAQPAQITDSQIAWNVNLSTGQYSYVLSRLTGQLSWRSHDQIVGDDGGAMKCEVGTKPAPKF